MVQYIKFLNKNPAKPHIPTARRAESLSPELKPGNPVWNPKTREIYETVEADDL